MTAARPFIKTVGGKTQLLPELRKHLPREFNGYYEPFVGGGALFFDLVDRGYVNAADCTLGDRNKRLVRAYRGIRDDVDEVIHRLKVYAKHYASRGKDFYLATRSDQTRSMAWDDADMAAWYVFMNKAGFNGVYRENKQGLYNVPAGKFKTPPVICDEENLRAVALVLRNVDTYAGPFHKLLEGPDAPRKGDLVYMDPPYWPASATADFTSYVRHAFGPAEQRLLRDVALDLKDRGIHVMLSNNDVPEVRKLYARDFDVHRVEARRSVNSNVKKRGPVGELIIT